MKKYLVILFSLFCFLPVVMNAEVKSMNLVEALKDEGIESVSGAGTYNYEQE